MIAESIVCETAVPYAVLRKGDLDERDRAIVAAVARSATFPTTYYEIAFDTHISLNNLQYRIAGGDGCHYKKGGGLVQRGWLCMEPRIGRTLRLGPRFAGLDHDWPLEVVKA